MDHWLREAGKFGPAYTRWRLAAGRSFSCLVLQDATWRCQAYGRPCGIAQNPNRLPPGTVRLTLPNSSD